MEPVASFAYTSGRDPVAVTLLNADGSPALATRIAHDRQGNVTSVDNGRGKAELAYNRCGYPISMKDPLGNVLKICYNAFNAPAFTPDANGIVTKYTDNNAGLATRLERCDGSETLTSLDIAYDGAECLVREGSKTYRYGYLDKVLSVTDDDTTRTFTYHADGQLASATVGGGHRTIRYGEFHCEHERSIFE